MNSFKPQENVTYYTDLRAFADELLNYVSYTSSKESFLGNAKLAATNLGVERDTSNISELLLGNNVSIPLYEELLKILDSEKELPFIYSSRYEPFSNTNIPILSSKKISLFYHKANSFSDYSSVLSDISALFCAMIPTTEMSLCVPYVDVKIIYPSDTDIIPNLDILKFVGASSKSNTKSTVDNNVSTKYGKNIVGMELFGIPQTLAPTSDTFKTTEAYLERGVDVLDPIAPLLTLEKVNIQQIGFAAGLTTQTKINLDVVLHDRSRLSDIEVLTSSNIFPLVTFRVTYGWSHPDQNKMSKNIYAKILNSMRVTQEFALSSVSISGRSSSSLKLTLSLVGMGTQVSKGAKILTGTGEYLPYSTVDNLVKQFITLRSKNQDIKKGANQDANYATVGSTIISSVTPSASSRKFVNIKSFYELYKRLKTKISNDLELTELTTILNNLEVVEKDQIGTKFSEVFNFGHLDPSVYGGVANSILAASPQSLFVSSPLNSQIMDIAVKAQLAPAYYASTYDAKIRKAFIDTDRLRAASATTTTFVRSGSEGGVLTRQETSAQEVDLNTSPGVVIPFAEMISQLVAKPLLATQPDIDEVRIHCFSFNSSCGLMAQENIGNFPIVKSKFLQYKDGDSHITMNSSAETAMTFLLKQVNNPSSPFYGFAEQYLMASQATEALKKQIEEGTRTDEDVDADLEKIKEDRTGGIEKKNAEYLLQKGITGVDTSFIPPRVKHIFDVLPAYDINEDKNNPTKKIARIIVYDERSGGFNKLGNLIFSMINSNSTARVLEDGAPPFLSAKGDDIEKYLERIGIDDSKKSGPKQVAYSFKDKKRIREITTNLYPTLVPGSEGTLIKEATYSSQPSGELQSIYLFTAIKDQDGSSVGESSESPIIDDVFINPATVSLQMIGNVCIAKGQTYYVDFNTGTTLDNSYTVTSVSHNLSPGSFTTTANLSPLSSASIRTIQRQIDELVTKVKKNYSLRDAAKVKN